MRYRIEWIPRRCWQNGVEPADQRWTHSPNVFTGDEVELTRHMSELEADYDRSLVFRGVPLEVQPEDESPEERARWCEACGGDRVEPGSAIACRCPCRAQSGVRTAARDARRERAAS